MLALSFGFDAALPSPSWPTPASFGAVASSVDDYLPVEAGLPMLP